MFPAGLGLRAHYEYLRFVYFEIIQTQKRKPNSTSLINYETEIKILTNLRLIEL